MAADFLVSYLPGYRALRQMLTGAQNLSPITRPGQALELARELRADQYGLRTLVPLDMAVSKLLANSDRWADDAVYSRDLMQA